MTPSIVSNINNHNNDTVEAVLSNPNDYDKEKKQNIIPMRHLLKQYIICMLVGLKQIIF